MRNKLFLAGIWWAWRARNSQCLGKENFPLLKLLASVRAFYITLHGCFPDNTSEDHQERWVKLHPLGDDRTIMNVDGSSFRNPGRAGFGGLVRRIDGSWVSGFSGSIGFSDNWHAELSALLHGLQLAWNEGIRNLLCYTDSMNTINLIRDPLPLFHKYAVLLQDICEFLQRD